MQSFFPRFNFLAVKIVLTVVAKAPDIAHVRLAVFQPVKIIAGDPPPFILKLALYGIAEKLDRPRVNVIGYDALVIFVGNGKVCHCAATGKEVVEVFCRGENFKNLCSQFCLAPLVWQAVSVKVHQMASRSSRPPPIRSRCKTASVSALS